jgi:hypothetical protein
MDRLQDACAGLLDNLQQSTQKIEEIEKMGTRSASYAVLRMRRKSSLSGNCRGEVRPTLASSELGLDEI